MMTGVDSSDSGPDNSEQQPQIAQIHDVYELQQAELIHEAPKDTHTHHGDSDNIYDNCHVPPEVQLVEALEHTTVVVPERARLILSDGQYEQTIQKNQTDDVDSGLCAVLRVEEDSDSSDNEVLPGNYSDNSGDAGDEAEPDDDDSPVMVSVEVDDMDDPQQASVADDSKLAVQKDTAQVPECDDSDEDYTDTDSLSTVEAANI